MNDFSQTAFDNLGEDASELMGMLCFMSPESVPLSLFQGNDWKQSRPQWGLLEDVDRIVQSFDPLF